MAAEALHCGRRRREYRRLSSLDAVEKGPHWLTGCSVEMGAIDTSFVGLLSLGILEGDLAVCRGDYCRMDVCVRLDNEAKK